MSGADLAALSKYLELAPAEAKSKITSYVHSYSVLLSRIESCASSKFKIARPLGFFPADRPKQHASPGLRRSTASASAAVSNWPSRALTAS